jgi:hypothetical protein
MKKIILGLFLLITVIPVYGQYEIKFNCNNFIFAKDLKKLDKRFKNLSNKSDFRYLIISVFNPTENIVYLFEYQKLLSIEKGESFFDDNPNVATASIPNNAGSKIIPVMPHQKKDFIVGLVESHNKKLIKQRLSIAYTFEKKINYHEIQYANLEINAKELKEFCRK